MTTYTKKFKEFIEEYNPKSDDYVVGYRGLDNGEVRIPLVSLDNSITANKYIRKDIDDYANGIIRFNKGFTADTNIMSTIYLQGMSGWIGNSKGDFEMNSLTLREFLEVPELRKNKITVMGNQFWFTDSAMTKEVVGIGLDEYSILLKLEEGEYGSFEINDVLKGIYHYNNGFYTVYLQVYELILDGITGGEIGIRVRSLNGKDPQQAMLLARVTNTTDEDRQGSLYADGIRKYIRVLDGYNPSIPDFDGSIDTLKVQIGDLSTVTNHPVFGNLEGYGLYADNVYLQGKIIVKNDPNQPGQELGVYRGTWSSKSTYYKFDQVTYNGSLYTSKAINNVGNVPTGQLDDIWWELTISKGSDGTSGTSAVIMELTNDNHNIPTDSEGKNPVYGGASTQVLIFQGTTDVTDTYEITTVLEGPTTAEQFQFVQNGNTIIVTFISDVIDNASIRITATAEGYPTVNKVWTVTKVKSGINGEDATAYWIVTDSPVIKKLPNGAYEPSPFVIRAFSQTGTNDVIGYDGFIRLSYGSEVQVVAGSVYQFIPSADVTKYTIELFAESALKTLLDKEIVSVVEDGADGISPYILNLDNDAALVPADATGIVLNYDLAVTNAVLYIGQTKLNCTFEVVILEPGITYTMSPEGKLQVTYIPKDIDIINAEIHAVVKNVRVSSTIFTISKVRPGADGSPALIYQLQPSVNVVKRDKDGVLSTNTITVKVLKYIGSELPVVVTNCYIRFKLGEDAGWTTYLDGIILRDETQVINIELYDKQDGTLFDAETIPVISDGKPGENGKAQFKSIVFLRSNNEPVSPTGGSYLSPVPMGWSDGAPTGLEILWMSSRIFTNDGNPPQQSGWTTPTQMTNTASFEAYFSQIQLNPGNPTSNPSNWSVVATEASIWMATRTQNNGIWESWAIVKIKGEKGDKGDEGSQGLHGKDGLQGPSIAFGGVWLGATQYYAYADTQTCVTYNGKYYYTKTTTPELSPIIIPAGDANNPSSDAGKIYWAEFVGQFDNIATGLLMAERIATSELTANKLFIVDRQESTGDILKPDGTVITKDEEKHLDPSTIIGLLRKGWYLDQSIIRSIATVEHEGQTIPKLKLDEDGVLTATGVNVSGTVHFFNGTIGKMEVYSDTGWTNSVTGPYPASTGFYYLRKEQGVTITPQGHIIGKDYFLTGDSTQGPSVFVGDVYVPGYDVPGMDNTSLSSFLKLWNSLFEKVLINNQYHIKAKLPLFSIGEITAYGSDGMEVDSIWASIPVDKKTIDLVDGKLTVVGGIGGIAGIVLPVIGADMALNGASLNAKGDTITFTATSFVLPNDSRLSDARIAKDVYPWAKAATKPSYTYSEIGGNVPVDLSGYVTLGTNQTITGVKKFTGKIEMNYSAIIDNANFVGFYTSIGGGKFIAARGILVSGSYSDSVNIPDQGIYAIGEIKANSFTKRSGTASQLLRADGGVAKFTFDLLPGQPGGLWGGNINHDYVLWNPANFNVDSSSYLRTAYNYGQKLNPQEYFNRTIGLKVAMTGAANIWSDTLWINGYSGSDVPYMSALHFKRENIPGMYISNQQGGATTYGTMYKVLTEYDWTGIVDGRYLPLSGGGIVSGDVSATSRVIANGWFQNNATGVGLHNAAEDARWFANGGAWYADKRIYAPNITANGGYIGSIANGRTVTIGSQNADYCHYNTSAGSHFFNRAIYIDGNLYPWGSNKGIGSATIPWGDMFNEGWFRSIGNVGWYNQTYGGGIYMDSASYVKTFGSKAFMSTSPYYYAFDSKGGYSSDWNNSLSDNWTNALTPNYSVFNTRDAGVAANTCHNILGWADTITGAGYRTRYSIRSIRGTMGFGTMALAVGNNDAGTTGHQLLIGGNGDMTWSGSFIASQEVTAYSDQRLKSNIQNLTQRGRLQAKTFIKDGKQSIGFIAQDIQTLYPELVQIGTDENHYLSLNYGAITAVLSVQLNTVEDEVSVLKEKVNELESKLKQYEIG